MAADTVTLYCFAHYRPDGPLSGYSYAETTDAGTAASLRAWAQYEEIAVDWAVEIPRGSWPPLPREDAMVPTRLEHHL